MTIKPEWKEEWLKEEEEAHRVKGVKLAKLYEPRIDSDKGKFYGKSNNVGLALIIFHRKIICRNADKSK